MAQAAALSPHPPRELRSLRPRSIRGDSASSSSRSPPLPSPGPPSPSSMPRVVAPMGPASPSGSVRKRLPTIPAREVIEGEALQQEPGTFAAPFADDDDAAGPPPAPSASFDPTRPVTRKRRSSSIKRKPSPGVVPKSVVDWEIPRKTFHSSIGFLTLVLNHLDPPTVRPLILILSVGLLVVVVADFLRFRSPVFAETWEAYLGFLMRESERNKINGVVWYLIGVITVLALYPRDVAVVSILTLSWSDTTASTLGRLWGRYTPPLPAHFPGVPALKFAPRKSLAGFLAATVTGSLIGLCFFGGGSARWTVLDSTAGWLMTAGVVGVGGAVVEALDLGVDDNLSLPILTGALVWAWLATTSLFV
ncbi:Diacylglycerol kinase [Cryptotrichosporon argae]